jgi:hypothetical protein
MRRVSGTRIGGCARRVSALPELAGDHGMVRRGETAGSGLAGREVGAVSVTAPGPPSVASRVPVRGPHDVVLALDARTWVARIRASQCICAGQRRVRWAKERGL